MSALTQARMPIETKYKTVALPLAAAAKAFQGGIACIDTSSNTIKEGKAGSTTLLKIGEFAESFDNTSGTASVQVLVNLDKEISLRWYDNATGGAAATVSNLFASCYILDDHTVTTTSSGNSVCGRIWAVDSVKGVAVQTVTTGV